MIKSVAKKVIPHHIRLYLRYLFDKNSRREDKQLTAFYSFFVKPGDTVFDIGANYGNRVSSFLSLNTKVVAVEPQRTCVTYLRLRFGNKIKTVRKGCADQVGKKEFYISTSPTLSTFSTEYIDKVKSSRRFGNVDWKKKQIIDLTTLDALIDQFGKPSFVKIDVEGFEDTVLAGLTKTIGAVSFEYCVPEQIEKNVKCLELLERSNPGMKFNYSSGESYKMELPEWIGVNEMKKLVLTQQFLHTGFGDIYGKHFSN